MKAPLNRRVFVIGYGAITPLGKSFHETWNNALQGKAGFGTISRCEVDTPCNIVGEIPDWDPLALDFISPREAYMWDAGFVILTMAVCKEALFNAGLEMTKEIGQRTACLIGSAINGADSFRKAVINLETKGPLKVSPMLLPNICGNLPAGKAGMLLGYTGPIFSPQGACASGNHAIGIGSRMIRDGDCDFVLAGGIDMPIIPEIVHGFANMNATIKVKAIDRAHKDPSQASRPFSVDRKGFVLSEGAGTLVLAAEDMISTYQLTPKAEILGIGWNSDAYHYTRPNPDTITSAIHQSIDDAGLKPEDIQYINAHGTSTPIGDKVEIECLKEVFQTGLKKIPISSNKSQIGHTLGAAAAIEAAFVVEGMNRGIALPTINYIQDPELTDIDLIPHEPRKFNYDIALSNAFGFGGTNCCIVIKGV